MYEFRQFYIDGEWHAPAASGTLPVVNPATEEQVGVIAAGTEDDTDAAVAAARRAFDAFSRTTPRERKALLESILRHYSARYDEIAAAITAEMGAPVALAQGSQARSGVGHLTEAIRLLGTYEFEVHDGSRMILREPIGTAGLITPWNWPVNQVMCKVAPALAAGCTTVLKPSEIAPLSAAILAEVFHEAGVPAGVFNLVNGRGAVVGARLAGHPDLDMISFTGSTRAGVLVARAAAPSIKRVSQELGGKSAAIVLPDANLAEAVSATVRACFRNSGQSCDAPTRMLVPANRHDEAVAIARGVAEETIVGDPLLETTEVGPVVSDIQYARIQRLIQTGLNEGADLAAGGPGRPDGLETGYYVRPTVFSNVSNTMAIAREEIFGPVLAVIPFTDEDDAVQIANDSPYGLSGYVWAGTSRAAERVARRLRTGMVHLNGADDDYTIPFGGYKKSGNGREWGRFGLEEYLEVKIIMDLDP